MKLSQKFKQIFNIEHNKFCKCEKCINKLIHKKQLQSINKTEKILTKKTYIKSIKFIQKLWKIFYYKNYLPKVIKIQALYIGYYTRKAFNEILIINKKLHCLVYILTSVMFKNAINYNYEINKKKQYLTESKLTKYYLILRKGLRSYILLKKIRYLMNNINGKIYIQLPHFLPKIPSKKTDDKYKSKPIFRFNRPLSKITKIQRKYKLYYHLLRVKPKKAIDKIMYKRQYFISKLTKIIKIPSENEFFSNLKNSVINNYEYSDKVIYDYRKLTFIQKYYKYRFKKKLDNYLVYRYRNIKKKVLIYYSYFSKVREFNHTKKLLTLQRVVKTHLYNEFLMNELIRKPEIEKCEFTKPLSNKNRVKKNFYEYFAHKLKNLNFYNNNLEYIFNVVFRKINPNLYIKTESKRSNIPYSNEEEYDGKKKKLDLSKVKRFALRMDSKRSNRIIKEKDYDKNSIIVTNGKMDFNKKGGSKDISKKNTEKHIKNNSLLKRNETNRDSLPKFGQVHKTQSSLNMNSFITPNKNKNE